MKTTFFNCLILLVAFASYAQKNLNVSQFEILDPNTAGKIFRNPLSAKNKPKGSPYVQLLFAAAKVENVEKKAFMRYNVYSDEFEFITSKNDTLILDKTEAFNTITFSGTNKKYKLANYINSKGKLYNGYLIAVYEKGDYALYKKENITYYEEKVAKTTLESNMPAKYVKSEDTYFMKNKDNPIAEFPDSKKQLVKLFPEKKEAIELFVKANKISFSGDADRIKIIDFLATL